MFKFNIKSLYFFGSNIVVNNLYCTNTIKKKTFILHLPTDSDYYLYNNIQFNAEGNTFGEVLGEMDLDNFVSLDNKKIFSNQRNGAILFKIVDINNNQIFFDKNSSINFSHQYHLYFTNNYFDSTDDSIIKIQNKDNSDYTEYKKNYRLFIDRFKDIRNEDELKTLIYGLNKDISNDFKDINDIISNYYIEEFKFGLNTIIDNKNPFKKDAIKKITKDPNKKIEIKLSKFNKYFLREINLTSDLAKIYKIKDLTEVKTKINVKISKSRKKLTYDDIQNIITNDLKYDGIILNNKLTDNLISSFYITVKEDSKNHFTEPKKCTITFVSNEFELEDAYKSPIEIIFDDKVNEGTKVQEYIFNTYKLNDTICEIKNEDGSKVSDNITFSDGHQRNIIIKKHVADITKKKEDDSIIINIEIITDKPDEFKLKDNIVKNKQIVLKKGNCKIKDLLTNLKDNGYNGIEKDGIIKGIFLLANPSNNILKSTEELIGGQYKILLSGQENNFVEKLVKKPSKKDITLTIVPKDETKYKLNEISNSISISVIENISYNDFVNEIKKIITDGRFEVYIDNINVKSGNIDINKQIVIKLLDDCNKLKKIKKDNDEDNKDDGDGKEGGNDGDKKNNESTTSTKKCQCSKK